MTPFRDSVACGSRSDGHAEVEEVCGVRPKGYEHLHAGHGAARLGHSDRLLIGRSIVLAAVNRDVVIGSVRQEERSPTCFLERLRGEHALKLRSEVDVVVKDWEPRGHLPSPETES